MAYNYLEINLYLHRSNARIRDMNTRYDKCTGLKVKPLNATACPFMKVVASNVGLVQISPVGMLGPSVVVIRGVGSG